MRYFVTDLKPMQVVWYENKALAFSSGDVPADATVVRIDDGCDLNPANLLQKFDNRNTLYILTDDPEGTLEKFCSTLAPVEAAGGLVENGAGEILLMRRRGWWDLPKGHVEAGETHEQAALREVAEETGLTDVSILQPLGTTQHFYNNRGRWEMKRTWWYRMRYDGAEQLVPQTEEDITELRWMKGAELWRAVSGTFGTIREVFDAYVNLAQG